MIYPLRDSPGALERRAVDRREVSVDRREISVDVLGYLPLVENAGMLRGAMQDRVCPWAVPVVDLATPVVTPITLANELAIWVTERSSPSPGGTPTRAG